MNKKIFPRILFFAFAFLAITFSANAQYPRFKVLCFNNNEVEPAHREFEADAIRFFKDLTVGNGFVFDVTNDISDCNEEKLKNYDLVMMLSDQPHSPAEREAFKKYMENGGGYIGFHAAGYNDQSTKWPWWNEFLGCGTYYRNQWPPMPAKAIITDKNHPITKGLPDTFIAPANEWYQWNPSPCVNKDVKVLVSLSPDNYPFGLKDQVRDGEYPVVWTNTKYRMVYLNMGHGNRIFSDATQNYLIINAFRWVVASNKKGNVFGDPVPLKKIKK